MGVLECQVMIIWEEVGGTHARLGSNGSGEKLCLPDGEERVHLLVPVQLRRVGHI